MTAVSREHYSHHIIPSCRIHMQYVVFMYPGTNITHYQLSDAVIGYVKLVGVYSLKEPLER